jgi:hypothetical protein
MVRSLVVSLFTAGCLAAQDEPLRRAFEGKSVAVKIDMPGDDGGINIYPRQEVQVDYRKLGDAVKRYGVSLRKGDEVTVTKVHLKPKLIEFQLGGGGYGSWGDMSGRPSVPSTSVPKSRRERDLEKDRDGATGDRRRTLDRELDYLRRDRQREESQLRIVASRAQIEQQEWEAERRRRSGSRFNIHYPEGVPPEAATPQAVMAALAEFVDFGAMKTSSGRREDPPALRSRPSAAAPNPLALKKGMSEEEVENALGAPVSRTKGEAAGLPLVNSTYDLPETTVKAQFVNGVLAKYTITVQ